MGRSPRNSADIGVTAWETVRRALGRLAMRPRVNALAFDAAPPEIVALPLASRPDVFAGRVENQWRPIAALAVVDLPGAISVVADVDLADVPVTVSANASAANPEIGVSPSVVSEDELPSYAIRNFEISAPAILRADRALIRNVGARGSDADAAARRRAADCAHSRAAFAAPGRAKI